jgi:predicted DNA-binding WGR domain protein
MSRRFEFSEGSSNKVWEIAIDGHTVLTTYGRIGSAGQVMKKAEGSAEKAQAAVEKLIKQKTAKGYVEVGVKSAPAPKKSAASGKHVTVSVAGTPKYIVPLAGARCVVLDDTQTLTWFDAHGKKLGTRKVGESSAPRASPTGNVAIKSEDQVLVLAATGKPVLAVKHDCARAMPGHLLRSIAFRVLENDERFSEFNWG